MAKLGSAVTNRFMISQPELRIGPISLANRLTQANSVGLIQSASVEMSTESVDLEAGLPRTIWDTAITRQGGQITAPLNEYSRRNLAVMLGGAPTATLTAAVQSLMVDDQLTASNTVTVTAGEGANFTAGDIVVVYPLDRTEEVTTARIESIAGDVLTLDAGTALLHDYAGTTDQIQVYKSFALPLGAIERTNYFSATLMATDRNGRPFGFVFWKCAISSGLTMNFASDDFQSTDFQFKVLQPSIGDYATGQPLSHLSNVIPSNPFGAFLGGSDLN